MTTTRTVRPTGVPVDLVFLGPPGAGKGTQAGIFRERHGVPHISAGGSPSSGVRDGNDVARSRSAATGKGLDERPGRSLQTEGEQTAKWKY